MSSRKQTSKDVCANASLRVYSVINFEYMQLGLAWGKRVREVSGQMPIFICSDAESLEFLNAHGFPCAFKPSEIPLSAAERKRWVETNFASDKAIYTANLKFVAAAEFLRSGHPILYSDVDAMWIRNPIPCLLQQNADLLYQPAHARKRKTRGWSIEACSGFFYMRSCDNAKEAVEKMIFNFLNLDETLDNSKHSVFRLPDYFKSFANHYKDRQSFVHTRDLIKLGCDQDLFNAILRRDYQVEWSAEPSNWEHCSLENGWVEPVRGTCRRTKMNLVALPHAYFQRQGTTAEAVKHAVVCHPIAGQTQAEKFEKFKSLGINLLDSR